MKYVNPFALEFLNQTSSTHGLNKNLLQNYLSINDKKLYKVTNIIVKKLEPTQKIILDQLSDFSTRIFNLAKL